MRGLRYPALIAVAMLTQASSVRAQPPAPNQTVVQTTDPILFGNGSNWTLQGNTNGWQITSAVWEYQWSVGGCTPAWAACPANPSINLQYPGTLTVRCTIQYNDGSGGHKTSAQPKTSISVPPPDGIRIVSGDNVSKPLGRYNPTIFQITCKTKDSFYIGGAYAQERITNIRNPKTGAKLLPDQPWAPVPGAKAAAIFGYAGMGLILDQKGYTADQAAINLPAGTGLLTSHQEIRVILADPCGKAMTPINLKAYDITMTKDTQNQQGGTYTVSHK